MKTFSEEFVDKFTAAFGAKQIGVIVHGGGICVEAFEEEAEVLDGAVIVRCAGHTRLYAVRP